MEERKSDIILRASDLTAGYKTKSGNFEVCKGVNFDLCRGELIGLVGPNGVGKSTLIRSISNVQPILNGSVSIKNKSLRSYSQIDLAKELSVVLTDALVTKGLSVREIVALGRQPYTNWIGRLTEEDKGLIHSAIETTNISKFLDKKAFELSDGQLQKVMIARALAQDTELIILDEPTTHLDLYHKAKILSLLKAMTENSNKCILFSSHDIELCIELCDKLLVMNQQKVLVNSPEMHIKNGNFDTLFPIDLVEFDSEKKAYRIKK